MKATVEICGSDVFCRVAGQGAGGEARLPLSAALDRMKDWARRYGNAVRIDDQAALLPIGREIGAWLNQSGWLTGWTRRGGARELEIFSQSADPNEAEAALLDLPWEILASEKGFLVEDSAQSLVVWRRLGLPSQAQPWVPLHSDLALLFMAAAPEGENQLNFEAEEAAILDATRRLPLALAVEESGALPGLEERLGTDGPFEGLHLSCHGGIDRDRGPVLALEDETGRPDLVSLADFTDRLGGHLPPLVFLSACRTAENEGTESFIRALARCADANVIGWDGSVYDQDAILFASTLYRKLVEKQTVPQAVAVARREVLNAHRHNAHQGQHWHLARVYLGQKGGGSLCQIGQKKRTLRRDAGDKEFLVKTEAGGVAVASARTFVGRRRAIQTILREFAEGRKVGVLIHGMGNLGKSSLAMRIIQRLTPRYRSVVVFPPVDKIRPLPIFDYLLETVPVGQRQSIEQEWREKIAGSASQLADAVEAILTGPLADSPLLLVIDDMEQILEAPAPGQERTPVQDAYRAPLQAVIQGFDRADSASRLLLTSRYRFTLLDGKGKEWESRLFPLQLRPMEPHEQAKQWRAAQAVGGSVEENAAEIAARALRTAAGNPGLQEILCRPLLNGETALAAKAIEAVETFRQSGKVPADDNQAQEFFRRVPFEDYRNALTSSEQTALRAAGLFSDGVPLPRPALVAVVQAAGVMASEKALDRLLGLGLLDDWGESDGLPQAALNPLARPLGGEALSSEDQAHLAAVAIAVLEKKLWRDAKGNIVIDPRAIEAARLALLGNADPAVIDATTLAAMIYLFRIQHQARQALDLFDLALPKLEAAGQAPSLKVLMIAAQCAERIGETKRQIALLERGLSQTDADPILLAQTTVHHVEATLATTDPESALKRLEGVAEHFRQAGDVYSRAVTMGKIADIYYRRGRLDEALKIRQEEQLPVYELLDDVRSRAVTKGNIADIYYRWGQLDEALKIRREEQLPVYERLGDVRERAVTLGNIADIYYRRGQLDEALKIRREGQLPIYERLGDVRLRAMTMDQIADILMARGQLDEALKIRQEEELPVYQRLGDVRSRAVTMGKIADILMARGQIDEAFNIRQEEELPVYQRLGDVRSRAVTMGKIADILMARGQLDEAFNIRQEEELPVYQRLGDVHEHAVTMCKIVDILMAQGQIDEAFTIMKKQILPAFERLGAVREQAMTIGRIADILMARGQLDEALKILQEEMLPAFERLGDIDGIAATRFKLAQIRLEQEGVSEDDAQGIVDDLQESFGLLLKTGRADGLVGVGLLFGQVLAARGESERALSVLEIAAGAAEKLERDDYLTEIQALQKELQDRH